MAARLLLPSAARALSRTTACAYPTGPFRAAARSFQTTPSRRQETPIAVLPVRKPVGAFRGSIFGFLLGSTLAGAALYYYVIDEYKVSNELLIEDIYALQAAVARIEGYVKTLEEKQPKK